MSFYGSNPDLVLKCDHRPMQCEPLKEMTESKVYEIADWEVSQCRKVLNRKCEGVY